MTPTYNHFLEVKKIIQGLPLDSEGEFGYFSFNGPNTRMDQFGEDEVMGSPEINRIIASTIIRDVFNKAGQAKGMPRFNVAVTPFGGYDASQAALIFKLPE